MRSFSMAIQHAEGLAALARSLAAEPDLAGVLTHVVKAALTQIEGAEHAGITTLSRQATSTPAASDELVLAIDDLQYSTGEGPCLTAAADHENVVIVDDLTTDSRWPVF